MAGASRFTMVVPVGSQEYASSSKGKDVDIEAGVGDNEGEGGGPSANRKNMIVFVVFIFVFVPIVIVALSFLFGGLLAAVEKWTFMDGFYYVISTLLGLPNPLTQVSPENTLGKFVDIVVSLWSLALSGTIIGVVGSMSVVNLIVDNAEKFKFGGKDDLVDVKAAVMKSAAGGAGGGDGEGLDFEAFHRALSANGPAWPEKLARSVFTKLDKDGSGFLDPHEVENVASLREFIDPAAL